jgi:hypothetical protein
MAIDFETWKKNSFTLKFQSEEVVEHMLRVL